MKMAKEVYENPVMEIVEFEVEDVITASDGGDTEMPQIPIGPIRPIGPLNLQGPNHRM